MSSFVSENPIFGLLLAALAVISFASWLLTRPSYQFPSNAPPLISDELPIVGSLDFFHRRWDFFMKHHEASSTGNFSFFAGPYPIVSVTGEYARKVFFEDKRLSFTQAYVTLFGGAASLQRDSTGIGEDDPLESGFIQYFHRRLTSLMRPAMMRRRLPLLLNDARAMMEELARQPLHITDPFVSIYKVVFQLTMRTVSCEEIANDPVLAAKCMKYFETLDGSGTALTIMYPWLPTPSKLRRLYAGGRLFFLFRSLVEKRKQEGRREDDAVQLMLDEGDSIQDMLTTVIGSLFAGQINAGVNAAYIIARLAEDKSLQSQVRVEIERIARKYCSDQTLPLRDALMSVPLEAWEGEFELVDACLKESIRFNLPGSGFRWNRTNQDIPLNKEGTEVIPSGAFVALASGMTHYNANIFTEPEKFDPGRYLAPRREHEQEKYAWAGWGGGRHPCLGMRFAKLEMSMIVSFFLAYFGDFSLCDQEGKPSREGPVHDANAWSAKRPSNKVYVKY